MSEQEKRPPQPFDRDKGYSGGIITATTRPRWAAPNRPVV